MIRYYPSRRAVFAVALGIPLSLLAALVAPALWTAGLAWSLFAALLMGLDLVYGASARKLTVTPQIPGTMGVGRAATAQFTLQFAGAVPAFAQSELEGNERFAISPRRRDLEGGLQAEFELKPLRRGEGRLENLWLRWTGPMGLCGSSAASRWPAPCPSCPISRRCARKRCACSSATSRAG